MNLYNMNKAEVSGSIAGEPCRSHTSYDEDFMSFSIVVKRLSEISDVLPVIVSSNVFDIGKLKPGEPIQVRGQLRSYNELKEGYPHLRLHLFAREIGVKEEGADKNIVIIEGYTCKKPIYRITPFGREITDLLVAVNRPYGKSDYIPIIVWGKNARFAEKLKIGQKLRIEGRFQSRQYEKNLSDGKSDTRTAYEVSVCSIYLIL